MHLNSRLVFERHAVGFIESGKRVLEIGPDAKPSTYQSLVTASDVEWTTVDLVYDPNRGRRFASDGSGVDYAMTDPYSLPFPDESFDVVVSGQVLEHVPRVWAWFVEIARVCRPGGYILTVNPVSWPYHEAPVDCWRVFPEGMRALCTEAGLQVLTSQVYALEPRISRRTYPGESHRWNVATTRRTQLKDRIRCALGWPTPTALDTLTIARKPATVDAEEFASSDSVGN